MGSPFYAPPLVVPFRPPAFAAETRLPGLIALARGVKAILPALHVNALVTVTGWTQREQQLNQGPGGANRVSFMPGLDGGEGGTLEGKEHPTRAGQVIAPDAAFGTVSIWAADSSSSGAIYDEEAQYLAWWALFQATVYAMHAASDAATGEALGLGALALGKYSFTKPPADMAFGLEALLEFTQFSPILAPTIATATPQAAVFKEPA